MNNQYLKTLAIFASAAAAAGCSTMAAEKSGTYESSRSSAMTDVVSADTVDASRQRITSLEAELAESKRQLEMAQKNTALGGMSSNAGDAASSLFPPNPKAGQCYARVLIPASYNTISEQVVVREAGERFEIIPARYETVSENRLIKEASTRLEVIPAEYSEVEERILVKPATKKIVEVAAVYETVTERVLDKAAHTVWKKGPPASQSASVLSQTTSDTGEIMCLVEVPATYKTVEKRVLVTPARTEEIDVPAEYETVTKMIVTKPAETREITIPAEYGDVQVTKIVAAAKQQRIAVPAEIDTINKTTKVSDESMEWRQVVCEVNLTRDNVLALQKSLADKGYYKAGLDGIIGGQTLAAAREYALDSNLPAGSNYVPIEVVESLNVSL